MNMILSIAAGGAIGAVLRHFVNIASTAWFQTSFPIATLTVNIIGSFIMGCLIAALAHIWSPSMEMKAFLTVGLLGAFTTFSAFSLDVVTLWERQAYWQVFAYGSASVIFSIAGLMAGMILVRHIVA